MPCTIHARLTADTRHLYGYADRSSQVQSKGQGGIIFHGSGQEPGRISHGSPALVSYGPPVASHQNVGFMGSWIYGAPFGIFLAIYRTLGYDSAVVSTSPVVWFSPYSTFQFAELFGMMDHLPQFSACLSSRVLSGSHRTLVES